MQEYLIWLVDEKVIRCLRLQAGEYIPAKLNEDGIFRSVVFPGLWLDLESALALNTGAGLRTLQAGWKTGAHQQFTAKLRVDKPVRRKRP